MKKLQPVHPGEILFEKFLKPMGISQNQIGRDLGISGIHQALDVSKYAPDSSQIF